MNVELTVTTPADSRVSVSMRLPRNIVHAVEDYAHAHAMSRTDAFLHFLKKGINSAKSDDQAELLHRIDLQTAEILRLLKTQQLMSSDVAPSLDDVKEAICRTARQFPAIRRAYLFGSFARGAAGHASDIDIRVELDKDSSFNLHDLSHFSKLIEQATGRPVDVVSARTIKNKALFNAIEREKVLVYDREAQRSRSDSGNP